MIIKKTKGSDLVWKSYDNLGELWFQASISLYDFSAVKTTDEDVAKKLGRILKGAVRMNSEFLNNWNAYKIETYLEFPKHWGLGSSSSLISMIADWADINPFLLHFKVSNGSGYDIACAKADSPIIYELGEESLHFEEVDWKPNFVQKLFFVSLNEKQVSEEAVTYYTKKVKNKKAIAKDVSALTEEVLQVKSFDTFVDLMKQHEALVSKALEIETVQSSKFSDFDGVVKSLGAWGGDFVLAATNLSEKETKAYFASKGFDTVIPYNEMVYYAE